MKNECAHYVTMLVECHLLNQDSCLGTAKEERKEKKKERNEKVLIEGIGFFLSCSVCSRCSI